MIFDPVTYVELVVIGRRLHSGGKRFRLVFLLEGSGLDSCFYWREEVQTRVSTGEKRLRLVFRLEGRGSDSCFDWREEVQTRVSTGGKGTDSCLDWREEVQTRVSTGGKRFRLVFLLEGSGSDSCFDWREEVQTFVSTGGKGSDSCFDWREEVQTCVSTGGKRFRLVFRLEGRGSDSCFDWRLVFRPLAIARSEKFPRVLDLCQRVLKLYLSPDSISSGGKMATGVNAVIHKKKDRVNRNEPPSTRDCCSALVNTVLSETVCSDLVHTVLSEIVAVLLVYTVQSGTVAVLFFVVLTLLRTRHDTTRLARARVTFELKCNSRDRVFKLNLSNISHSHCESLGGKLPLAQGDIGYLLNSTFLLSCAEREQPLLGIDQDISLEFSY
uniref:Uncharacterized protein n=1 Tax=Timema bartmani TaxID=61472 RepID=A0A7R9F0W9_9NEOP|nr:unnamed protein product [Timema bartmani]